MENVKWLVKLACVAGASLPFASNFLQLKSELEGIALEKRLQALEDPISSLHPSVPEVSKFLYDKIKAENSHFIDVVDEELSPEFRKAILLLSGAGWLKKSGIFIEPLNPAYVVYMAGLCEPDSTLNELVGYVDDCESGVVITAKELCESLKVPSILVLALFQLYSDKNLGLYDKTINHESYVAK
ncbi:TPA: hypothetical protein NK304_001795 [Vibrio parahaemolyticus]|uniref:hypothetical protein n=1 Tax=Vibrio TaxID=662 RepID=UPI00037D6818|nr:MULTISPECIES: hypothetical protein [Vibrio]EKD1484238.1 hypothetical protein [Vibrio alginolyticus]EWS67023.1 hypothetical protein Y702_23275 [Vibrio vulnificus BAA87]AYF14482.1 hypothetical protein FORC72_0751 [Vibrio parahaemolyticus]EGR3373983.1 hypothetical protein [Vibrio parahaemolyticus]EGR3418935.1 hypothetical protein [Vibrio parahaemolyticus]